MKRVISSMAIVGLIFGGVGTLSGCDKTSEKKSTYKVSTPAGEHKVEVKEKTTADDNSTSTKVEKKSTTTDENGQKVKVEEKKTTSQND